jgi:hydrogenase maturation factor
MLGEVPPNRLVTTGGAQPGDVVILTQRVAVEATAIIAREKRDELIHRHGFEAEFVDRCAGFIFRPGISVVRAAQVATATAPIHAMHDPTEGGVATGLWELATAAGVGLEIDEPSVPIFSETRVLCEAFGLDPWGAIASGSLLLTVKEVDAQRVCGALMTAGIEAAVIGRVLPKEQGVVLRMEPSCQDAMVRNTTPLPDFPRDEITRLFE